VNPGRQAQYAVGTKRVEVPNTKSTDPRIDPASRNLMLNNEAIFGLLGAQKGIAGNRFFTDVPKSRSNAFEINVGDRPISYDEGNAALSVLSRAGFTPDDFAIVPSPRGVRAMDLGVFDEDLVRMQAENPEMYKQAIKDRMERLNRFSGELGDELGGTRTPGFMDTIYAENAFDTPEGMFGQQYLPYIFPDDRPQFVDRFNAIAPGIAAALLATVAGLAVAIPSLFGYNYLLSRVDDVSTDNQIFVDELEKRIAETWQDVPAAAIAAE
jgi:hypothetical protein